MAGHACRSILDPASLHVLGLAISPGKVEAGRVGVKGHLIGSSLSREVPNPQNLVSVATDLLKRLMNRQTRLIGASVTGFIDADKREILLSSATPGLASVSLQPLTDQAGTVPIVLENDMHATAARWVLTHRAQEKEDSILVGFDDGALGAAILIDGHPNRGCATGASELGHCRFFVDTRVAIAGKPVAWNASAPPISCFKTARAKGPAWPTPSPQYTGPGGGKDAGAGRTGPLPRDGPCQRVQFRSPPTGWCWSAGSFGMRVQFASRPARFAALLLVQLADRVHIDLWDQPALNTAETAGWLALASLYRDGWIRTTS